MVPTTAHAVMQSYLVPYRKRFRAMGVFECLSVSRCCFLLFNPPAEVAIFPFVYIHLQTTQSLNSRNVTLTISVWTVLTFVRPCLKPHGLISNFSKYCRLSSHQERSSTTNTPVQGLATCTIKKLKNVMRKKNKCQICK